MLILPIKTKNVPERFPFATLALIVIKIVIYLATGDLEGVRKSVVDNWALTMSNASPVTLVSSMFLHGDPFHLLGNIWFLWLMGASVEGRLGVMKFLALYLASGMAGDAFHLASSIGQSDVPSLGASGAIMGLLGAAIYIFPHSKVNVLYWFSWLWHGIWEWRMWAVAIYYLGMDVVYAVLALDSGVAHFAHLGGAVGGVLAAWAFQTRRDTVDESDAKSVLSDGFEVETMTVDDFEVLASARESDPHFAFEWMMRCVKFHTAPSPRCRELFKRHVRQIVRDEDPKDIARFGLQMGQEPFISPQFLLEAATRLDREAMPDQAIPMLDLCIARKDCDEETIQAAVYKKGTIYEGWLNDKARALACFRQVASQWPMGLFAPHAAERIRVLENRP